MSDILKAKQNLDGHTICLAYGDKIITSDKRGIAPMLDFIKSGYNLKGFSVADLVVGKAAALLFVYCGITNVYAKVLSEHALSVLNNFGIETCYEVLTDYIVNRKGDGMCPMEKAVLDISEPKKAYNVLVKTLENLKKQ